MNHWRIGITLHDFWDFQSILFSFLMKFWNYVHQPVMLPSTALTISHWLGGIFYQHYKAIMLAAHIISTVYYLGCQVLIYEIRICSCTICNIQYKIIGVMFWNSVVIDKWEKSMYYSDIGKIGSRLHYAPAYKQLELLKWFSWTNKICNIKHPRLRQTTV